jgi:hypothetical protein
MQIIAWSTYRLAYNYPTWLVLLLYGDEQALMGNMSIITTSLAKSSDFVSNKSRIL